MRDAITNTMVRMARRLVPLCLFILVSFTASAQVGEYRTDLAVGFNGGYVSSNVGFVPEVPQSRLGGMTAGLTVRYTCEKYFKSICSLQAEVNITQTGWKEDIRDLDGNKVYYKSDPTKSDALRYERRMTYLQIPLLARLGWGRERKGLQGYIVLGPQIGTFLGESVKSNLVKDAETQTQRSSKVVAQDSLPVQRKFDYGIVVGAGVEVSMKKVGHFMIEGRYYYGLGDFFNNTKSHIFGRSNFGHIVVKATWPYDIIRTKNDKIK